MNKILLSVILIQCLFSVSFGQTVKAEELLRSDGKIIRDFLQEKIDLIKEMPITLFPEKQEKDLVLLRKGFKKYYFIKSSISRIKFDFEKKKKNLQKGYYKTVKVYVNPCLIKRFPVHTSYFYLKDVRIDREKKKFSFESIKFFFIFDLKQVSEYVYMECIKHGIHWPSFSMKEKNILLRGKLKIVGNDLSVRAIGRFELSDRKEIFFKVPHAKFSFVPVPDFVVGQIMKKLNPMIAIEKLPLGLYPFRIVSYPDSKIGLVFKN